MYFVYMSVLSAYTLHARRGLQIPMLVVMWVLELNSASLEEQLEVLFTANLSLQPQ